jgi:CheY-like chemotaxis protein
MENIPAILDSVANIAWPIIVVIVLLGFRSSIKELIETAKSRKFTVKVAGNELTMEELSEQQRNLIVDLQEQVAELQKQVQSLSDERQANILPRKQRSSPRKPPRKTVGVKSILWVDDNPKNNAYFIQSLQEQGMDIVTALSTREGLEKFSNIDFDLVISDMGRTEEGRHNPLAGIELTRQIRLLNETVPIFIFSSSKAAMEHGQEAVKAGASEVTNSPTTLLNRIQSLQTTGRSG